MSGILESRVVGSRLATRVKVRAGAFAGQRGIVVKVDHPGSWSIRLKGREASLPFGPSEVEVTE